MKKIIGYRAVPGEKRSRDALKGAGLKMRNGPPSQRRRAAQAAQQQRVGDAAVEAPRSPQTPPSRRRRRDDSDEEEDVGTPTSARFAQTAAATGLGAATLDGRLVAVSQPGSGLASIESRRN